jgi:hypothetical protein
MTRAPMRRDFSRHTNIVSAAQREAAQRALDNIEASITRIWAVPEPVPAPERLALPRNGQNGEARGRGAS